MGSREVATPHRAAWLAMMLGIDASKVKGTGPGGVITVEDVKRWAEETAKATAGSENLYFQ
uniref:1W4K_08 n=1 Tax=Pyrobaculum aerophilum TaxID=13773 RepID=UPI003624ACC8